MTEVIFKELNFELRRSNKRRTVGITVERDGQLIISAPPQVSVPELEQIIARRRFWIYSKLLKKESLNPPTASKEYISGEGFYYLGRSYRLKLIAFQYPEPPLKLHRGRFYLHRSAQPEARQHFITWYRAHLYPLLEEKITALSSRIEAIPRSFQIRELGNRWGSCSQKGDLYFHWRVAMLPHAMVEYAIVHEMVHLIEHCHSKEFWHRVERILPDYLERKQWLAENGVKYDL